MRVPSCTALIKLLTKQLWKLFADCLNAKHDLNFKYIWTSSGKILLRKNDDSPARLISCDRDLVKLCKSEASNSRNGLGEGTPVIYLDQLIRTFAGIVSSHTCLCGAMYNLLYYLLIACPIH